MEVQAAAGPPGLFAGTLHRRQQKAYKRGDDCYHDQQLDKGETMAGSRGGSGFWVAKHDFLSHQKQHRAFNR